MCRLSPLLAVLILGLPLPAGAEPDPGSSEAAHAPEASTTAPVSSPLPAAVTGGVVLETLASGGYVYALVEGDQGAAWVAAPFVQLRAGSLVEVGPGSLMSDFRSLALERTFEWIWFVQWVRAEGAGDPATDPHAVGRIHERAAEAAAEAALEPVDPGPVEPLEVGHTVESVHLEAGPLAGTEVAVRARVVKLNRGILGLDWLHLQDGTGDAEAGTDDLVATTAKGVAVQVGDLVIVQGTVATEMDLGGSYVFPVLLQDATAIIQ